MNSYQRSINYFLSYVIYADEPDDKFNNSDIILAFDDLNTNTANHHIILVTIKETVPNPFPKEADRLELDNQTKDTWGDILEEL